MRRQLVVLVLCFPLLLGFRGTKGPETEWGFGVGIGSVVTGSDRDNHGEIGVQVQHKFRNHPYDHRSGWLGLSASWLTYPAGGDLGNQMLTVGFMGGLVASWGELGGGLALFGDVTDVGLQIPLPIVRLVVGQPDRFVFRFGVLDDSPTWTTGGMMHWEGVLAVPFDKVWAPRLTFGARLDMYGSGFSRFPLELYLGVEPRIGRHVRIGVFGALGDGAGGPPTFELAARVTFAAGEGVLSDERPQPAD